MRITIADKQFKSFPSTPCIRGSRPTNRSTTLKWRWSVVRRKRVEWMTAWARSWQPPAARMDNETLVVYSADQGWMGGQNGLWGMGDHTRPVGAFELMMQIPLIFRHPVRIPPAKPAT